MTSLQIGSHVDMTEGNDWLRFMSRSPLSIEQTLLLLWTMNKTALVVVVLSLTQSFSLPFSVWVRGPASRGWVPTVGAPAGEGEEHRDGGRKGWRTESVLPG